MKSKEARKQKLSCKVSPSSFVPNVERGTSMQTTVGVTVVENPVSQQTLNVVTLQQHHNARRLDHTNAQQAMSSYKQPSSQKFRETAPKYWKHKRPRTREQVMQINEANIARMAESIAEKFFVRWEMWRVGE